MSPSDSRSKISLISQAFPLPNNRTTCSGLAMMPSLAIIISKTIKSQMAPSSILLAFKPKPKVKSFIQATKAKIIQQVPKFVSISSHENILCLLQLKKIFSNLPQAIIISIYQASLYSVGAFQESVSHSSTLRMLKIMAHGPTR